MTIYRGPGGTGEARTDSDVTEVRIIADEAEGYKDQAATSASAAASSASAAATAETNAETAEANAETAEANAEAAQAAAEAAQAAAEAAQTAAEAAQTAAELAETNAETAEANAETAEANAETAQAAAATSATNAAASASTATTQASNAASSASTATTQAGIATTKASEAASSATAAQSAQTAAESARDSALSAYDNFDDRYLGPKSSDPTLDNDGNALLTGALYYDTTSSVMKVYTGSSWVAAYVSAAGVLLAANNLSDLVSVSTARTNLGLGTAATTASTAYATAAQGTNADTAYGWGNHASAGYAADSAVVKLTGNQTVGGTKTFSSTITGSISGNAATATTATNLSGGTVSATSISDSGNLTFTGTGNRITGDFSNATHANRVAFQSSTTNGATTPFFIPNGTGNTAGIVVANASDPTNCSFGQLVVGTNSVAVISSILGTGSYLPMTFSTGGSERMRVDTSGNLGIGTSSPSTKLHLLTPSATAVALRAGNSVSYAEFQVDSSGNSQLVAPGGVQIFNTNGAERMRIDSSGNVGIGTSSPGHKLQVNGAIVSTDGTTTLRMIPSGGVGLVSTLTNHPLAFQTNDTERMRIDSSGNVGIGTSSPSAKLQVNGSSAISNFVGNDSNNYIQVSDNNGTSYTSFGAIGGGNAYLYSGAGKYTAFYAGGSERARIASTGQMSTTTGTGSVMAAYDARAWVNFNGTGTVAIRASGNVSSITDNGTGDYTINFTNAMPDGNYAVSSILSNSQSVGNSVKILAANNTSAPTTMSTSACRLVYVTTATPEDYQTITAMFVR